MSTTKQNKTSASADSSAKGKNRTKQKEARVVEAKRQLVEEFEQLYTEFAKERNLIERFTDYFGKKAAAEISPGRRVVADDHPDFDKYEHIRLSDVLHGLASEVSDRALDNWPLLESKVIMNQSFSDDSHGALSLEAAEEHVSEAQRVMEVAKRQNRALEALWAKCMSVIDLEARSADDSE
jgi:hypothetical protein